MLHPMILQLSWRRCALLRSKRLTLLLSSEYKKSPSFHHSKSSILILSPVKPSCCKIAIFVDLWSTCLQYLQYLQYLQIFGAHDEQRPTSTPRWNSSLLNIPRPRSLDSPRYLDPHGGVVRVKSGNSKKIFFAAISNPPWPRHQHIVESLTTASYLSIIWSD